MSGESPASLVGMIGLALNAAGLGFVAVQVILARRELRNSQEINNAEIVRRKRQSTIDFYMTTVEQRARWKETLPDDWDESAIEQFIRTAFKKRDRVKLRCLADYFGYFEALAVAVAADVYDLEIIDSLAGARIIHIAQHYKEYFERVREATGVDDLYVELEWLARSLQDLRSASPSYVLFANRRRSLRP